MKKIILHMGAGKTGTSALQAFFANNIDILYNSNYSYSYLNIDKEQFEKAKQYKTTGGNGEILSQAIKLNKEQYNKLEIEKIVKSHIDKANGKNILISSEGLGAFDVRGGKIVNEYAIKNGYKIIPIYYVRAISDHEMSRYQQSIKANLLKISFHEMLLTKSDCSFLRTIKNICEVFGKENIVVKNYDFVKENIISDFLNKVLNIDDISKFIIENKKVNRSLSNSEFIFMNYLNKFLDTKRGARFVSNAFINNKRDVKIKYKIEKKDFEILKNKYDKVTEEVNKYIQEDEEPLKIISNLEIVDEIKYHTLDETQENILIVLAEIIKQLNLNEVKTTNIKENGEEIILVEDINGYNIVKIGNIYIALLQSLGDIDLNKEEQFKRCEMPPYSYIDQNLNSLKIKIKGKFIHKIAKKLLSI